MMPAEFSSWCFFFLFCATFKEFRTMALNNTQETDHLRLLICLLGLFSASRHFWPTFSHIWDTTLSLCWALRARKLVSTLPYLCLFISSWQPPWGDNTVTIASLSTTLSLGGIGKLARSVAGAGPIQKPCPGSEAPGFSGLPVKV